eukprot:4374869-Amphidinium_carterae.2
MVDSDPHLGLELLAVVGNSQSQPVSTGTWGDFGTSLLVVNPLWCNWWRGRWHLEKLYRHDMGNDKRQLRHRLRL